MSMPYFVTMEKSSDACTIIKKILINYEKKVMPAPYLVTLKKTSEFCNILINYEKGYNAWTIFSNYEKKEVITVIN